MDFFPERTRRLPRPSFPASRPVRFQRQLWEFGEKHETEAAGDGVEGRGLEWKGGDVANLEYHIVQAQSLCFFPRDSEHVFGKVDAHHATGCPDCLSVEESRIAGARSQIQDVKPLRSLASPTSL